jgi:hypothetical protein
MKGKVEEDLTIEAHNHTNKLSSISTTVACKFGAKGKRIGPLHMPPTIMKLKFLFFLGGIDFQVQA